MTPLTTRRRTVLRVLRVLVAVLLLGASACGGSDGDDPAESGTTTPTTTPTAAAADDTTTTAAAAEPLRILVTNDDSVGAAGIDAVVEGLRALDDVEVTVVAPLENQSGSGGSTTDGPLTVSDAETISGYPAKAVDGFPADSVRVALEDLGLEPHVVVSGTNKGQNIGNLVDISGTVGAARAAVAAGFPALAVSTGYGTGGLVGPDDTFDFAAAVPFVVEWVTERREALLDGSAPVEVANLNVPTCTTGEVRGLHEAAVDYDSPPLAEQDCASAEPAGDSDVLAFNTGYAVLTAPLPDEKS